MSRRPGRASLFNFLEIRESQGEQPMKNAEQILQAELAEQFECDQCHDVTPKEMIEFKDPAGAKGIQGKFCTKCAVRLLSNELMKQAPDYDQAERAHALGTLASRRFNDLKFWARRVAEAMILRKEFAAADLEVPHYSRQEMLQQAERIVNKPIPKSQANPDVVHVGGGRLVPGAAKGDRREGLFKQD
jgi:hypothetical protein